MSDPKKTLPDIAETAADLLMAAAMMAKSTPGGEAPAKRFTTVEQQLRNSASSSRGSMESRARSLASVAEVAKRLKLEKLPDDERTRLLEHICHTVETIQWLEANG